MCLTGWAAFSSFLYHEQRKTTGTRMSRCDVFLLPHRGNFPLWQWKDNHIYSCECCFTCALTGCRPWTRPPRISITECRLFHSVHSCTMSDQIFWSLHPSTFMVSFSRNLIIGCVGWNTLLPYPVSCVYAVKLMYLYFKGVFRCSKLFLNRMMMDWLIGVLQLGAPLPEVNTATGHACIWELCSGTQINACLEGPCCDYGWSSCRTPTTLRWLATTGIPLHSAYVSYLYAAKNGDQIVSRWNVTIEVGCECLNIKVVLIMDTS